MATIVSGTSSQPGQFCAGPSSIHCAWPPIRVAAPTLSRVISGITTMACRARKHASWTWPRARTGRRSAGQIRSQIPVPTTSATSSGAASSARPADSTVPRRPCPSSSATATHTIRAVRGIHLTGLCQVSGSPGPGRPWALDAGWVTSPGRRGGWLRLGLGVSDQVPVPHRIVADGELEHAVEDQAPAAGPAPVEAEAELVQVALQVRVLDRALVGAQQPAFGQGGDPVDPGQQLARIFTAGAGGPLAAPDMGITEPGDPVVAHPAVGDHIRPRLDVAGEEGVQRAG